MKRALLSMLLVVGCAADESANPNLDGCETDADCPAGACYRGFCITGPAMDAGMMCPAEAECYEGPEGTEGEGLCRSGCVFEGPGGATICGNQVLPGEEVCNTVDDDCDGMTDEMFTLDTVEQCGSCTTRCASGESCCEARAGGAFECANLSSSADHCGECGLPCAAEQACCGSDGCVDVQIDTMHCGTCGNTCAPGLLCCDGACVNPNTSATSCGGCGTAFACGDGEECCAGTCMDACAPCEPACGTGETCCGGGDNCFDLLSDSLNCGRCGVACGVGERCCSGACVSLNDACADCDDDCDDATGQCCDGGCVATTSASHCGGCGITCGGGETCCETGCADTLEDNSNCGACGNPCGTDICSEGHCCPPGSTWCGETAGCQNLSGNNSHCGRCGNACTGLESCRRPTIGPGGYDCRTL